MSRDVWQDILDAWLRCQESWLYLEPIFNSEDIMKQMPVEGRKFNKVDRIWRNIMAKTVSDTRVLQATSQPNMLVSRCRYQQVELIRLLTERGTRENMRLRGISVCITVH